MGGRFEPSLCICGEPRMRRENRHYRKTCGDARCAELLRATYREAQRFAGERMNCRRCGGRKSHNTSDPWNDLCAVTQFRYLRARNRTWWGGSPTANPFTETENAELIAREDAAVARGDDPRVRARRIHSNGRRAGDRITSKSRPQW